MSTSIQAIQETSPGSIFRQFARPASAKELDIHGEKPTTDGRYQSASDAKPARSNAQGPQCIIPPQSTSNVRTNADGHNCLSTKQDEAVADSKAYYDLDKPTLNSSLDSALLNLVAAYDQDSDGKELKYADERSRSDTCHTPCSNFQDSGAQVPLYQADSEPTSTNFGADLRRGESPLPTSNKAQRSGRSTKRATKRKHSHESSQKQRPQQHDNKKRKVDANDLDTSLAECMRERTTLMVTVNRNKLQRMKQLSLARCKSIAGLFSKATRACMEEGVDEEDCTIEVTYRWKSEEDPSRITYIDRGDDSCLGALFQEIKGNPCWEHYSQGWCLVQMKVCQKFD